MRLFRRGEPASTLDLLVAGLGNPGREYERTRHNVGWLVADELARRHGGSFRSKFSGRLAEIRLAEQRLALLEPETYMNESGRSLGVAPQDGHPAARVRIAALRAVLDPLEAAVLEVDPRSLARRCEAHLDLGRNAGDVPLEGDPTRRLPDEHPAPAVLLAAGRALVEPASDLPFHHHRLDGVLGDRVRLDRPPVPELLREDAKGVLDAAIDGDRAVHGLDRRLRGHVSLPSLSAAALKAASASFQNSSK